MLNMELNNAAQKLEANSQYKFEPLKMPKELEQTSTDTLNGFMVGATSSKDNLNEAKEALKYLFENMKTEQCEDDCSSSYLNIKKLTMKDDYLIKSAEDNIVMKIILDMIRRRINVFIE